MRTDHYTAHTHSLGGKRTSSAGGHSHALAEVDAALDAMNATIAALDARVAALETPPPPPPATGLTYYLSPTGSDSAGGGIEAPWRTLGKFYAVAAPGDTLLVRGGTYSEAVRVTARGEPGAPIVVRDFPGETPVFTGSATVLLFDAGAAHHVVDGLTFLIKPSASSIIWVGNGPSTSGGPPTTGPITLRNLVVQKLPGGGKGSHGVYLSWWADRVLIEDSTFIGALAEDGLSNEAAVHVYHAPCATNTVVRRCHFENWSNGFLVWDSATPATANLTITDNTFTRNNVHLDLRYHAAISLFGNTGDRAAAYNVYDPNDAALTTASGNTWT